VQSAGSVESRVISARVSSPREPGGLGERPRSGVRVIESPFATVRLRQRVTKGAGSRTKGLLMAYKLLDMAQARWRRLDGAHLLPLVRAGTCLIPTDCSTCV